MTPIVLDAPQLLTIKYTAARLHVGERTLRRWLAEGRLPSVRIGGVVRIAMDDLNDFIAANGALR
jgi:excisionase family DNA binding protein